MRYLRDEMHRSAILRKAAMAGGRGPIHVATRVLRALQSIEHGCRSRRLIRASATSSSRGSCRNGAIRNKSGRPSAFFLLGAAIGAATALLMAPASGAQTRRRLRRQGEEVADYLIDAGKELVDKCEDLYERSGEVVDDAAHELSGNITPCANTAGNCWTRPKRSSAAQKAPPSAGDQERAPTENISGLACGGSRTIRRCDSLPASDDPKDSDLVRSRKAAALNLLGAS